MQTSATDGTEYTLRWRDHDAKLSETFSRAWEEKLFLDVTLACGNQTIAAHRLVLCACSPLLESLLCNPSAAPSLHPHPMLFFNDIPYEDLASLVEFMYKGAMTVTQQSLQGILNAAQALQIRGLCQGMNESVDSPPASSGSEPINYHHQQLKRKRSIEEEEEPQQDHYDRDGTQSEEETDSKDHCPTLHSRGDPLLIPPAGADSSLSSEQQQHLATLLHLAAMQQGTPLHHPGSKSYQHQPAGPSPALRSRLVWDPAHISMLENWYNTETRYPTIAQSQAYANTLSQTQPQDPSGRSRGPVTVTAQNVSHWFQNRRRKDNHPEIEEKRVKKRSARMKRQSTPLDLTQQSTPPPPPQTLGSGFQDGFDQQNHQYPANHPSFRRDSDDEAGPLFIAEKDADSDAENDENHPALFKTEHSN